MDPHFLLLYLIVSNVRQLFAADNFSRRHFQMHFILGALRVNPYKPTCSALLWDLDKQSIRSDQMPQNAGSDQALQCLLTEWNFKIGIKILKNTT